MSESTSDKVTSTGSTAAPEGVDGAEGVPGARWYVARVNSRHEKAVADKLMDINIMSYVATQKEMRLWKNGRRRVIDRVVIPSMVFVKCTESERRRVVTLPYIRSFLVNRMAATDGLRAPAAVISEAEMQTLRFMLGQTDHQVEFTPAVFRANDTVRVIRGSLCGLTGRIRNNPDGTHSLTVSIPMLGGAIMHIDPREVELIV